MFNTYKQENHIHENVNIKMPKIPTKYDLRELIKEIDTKVNECIMKQYDGREQNIQIVVDNGFDRTVLSLPIANKFLDDISKEIEKKYNIRNMVLVSEDFFSNTIKILIQLLGRKE